MPRFLPTAFVLAGLLPGAAAQAEDMPALFAGDGVTISGSFGFTSIKANELVYGGGQKLSQLIWKSDAIQTLTGRIDYQLPKDFYLRATGSAGYGGDGHMADYDWFYGGQAWSDRSLHPDTRLDHYFAGSIEVGRLLVDRNNTTFGLGAGLKYTDIKWSAWGGSYVYSFSGWRTDRGSFDPDEKGISFRQSWPIAYVGADFSHRADALTLSATLQAGVTVDAVGTDDHWVRCLRFYDHYDPAPALAASLRADYALRPNISLTLAGTAEGIFRSRADTRMVNTITGRDNWFKNDAGGDFRSLAIEFGLKGRF